MHEISLVQNLVTQLEQLASVHNADRVYRLKVEIGSRAGVVIDSFRFGFEVISRERPLIKDATLEIIEIHPEKICLNCQYTFDPEEELSGLERACPVCNSMDNMLSGGDEIRLLQVEME